MYLINFEINLDLNLSKSVFLWLLLYQGTTLSNEEKTLSSSCNFINSGYCKTARTIKMWFQKNN